MDGRSLLSLSQAGRSPGSFSLLPTDLQRLLALPDRSGPSSSSPLSPSSVSSRGTISSAVVGSELEGNEAQDFHAQLEKLSGILGLARLLHVNLERGLDASARDGDLARRAEWFGANFVAPPPARGLLRLMADAALLDTTNLILVVDGVVAVALGMAVGGNPRTDWMEGTCVLLAVLAIALVTAVGDFQKERQFRALNDVNENELVRVVRSGFEREDEGSNHSRVRKWSLVVGDVVQLEPGDVVPADGLAFNTRELKVDESTLTGEPELVRKGDALLSPLSTAEEGLPVKLFSGTRVMEGFAKMLVLCVGEYSQYGQITALINGRSAEQEEEKANDGAKKANKPDKPIQEGSYVSLDVADASVTNARDTSVPVEPSKPKRDKPTRRERTPLAEKIEALNLWLGKMGVVVATLIFVVLCARFSVETFAQEPRQPWEAAYLRDYLSYFILGTTILVVAIPEGLPLAVAIALVLAVRRMLRGRSLVRHLAACETVGNATTLCADKTGTLTANQMSVARLWLAPDADGDFVSLLDEQQSSRGNVHVDFDSAESAKAAMSAELSRTLCEGIALNSSAELLPQDDGDGGAPRKALGSQTEGALLSFATSCNGGDFDYARMRADGNIRRVLPFSSDRKRMSVVVRREGDEQWRMYTKGAPELVLARCTQLQTRSGATLPLTGDRRRWLQQHVLAAYAKRGYRTLCLAYRDSEASGDAVESASAELLEQRLVCLALVAIADPLRPGTREAVASCQKAGLVVRMVTGDSALTARSIARECGILAASEGAEDVYTVMEGPAFRALVLDARGELQQEAFDRVWPSLRVLARSSPQDKHTLVTGLRATELSPQLVAVTGDGTNDAPALRAAHVGFAMGKSGTSVAKEAADIVLMDDDLAGVVSAVVSGRGVFDGISQFLQFQLTVISVALSVACVGAVTLRQSPIAAVQILWVNLFMDVFASLVLTTDEPKASELLARRPYARSRPLVSPRMAKHIAGQTLLQLTLLLLLTFLGDKWFDVPSGRASVSDNDDDSKATQHLTIVFNTFVWLQLFNQLNCRQGVADKLRLRLLDIWSNKLSLAALGAQCGLQIAVVQLGGELFHCAPLNAGQWGACIGMGALALPLGWALRALAIEEPATKALRRLRGRQEEP